MKKILCMVLALVMMFAMSATAFAATSMDSPNYGEDGGHDHTWGEWVPFDGGQKRTCEECGITEIVYDESNPNTGAASVLGMAVLVSAAAVASFKREK